MTTRAFSRWPALGFIWLAGLVAPAAAQVEHHPDKHIQVGRSTAAAAVSTFRGQFDVGNRTLSGLQELEYVNRTDAQLTALAVRVPSRGEFEIDSILLFGVPLTTSEFVLTGRTLSLRLTQSVAPGQAAFFLISFREIWPDDFIDSRAMSHWVDWLPGVIDERGDSISEAGRRETRLVSTRSYVDLTVDSSMRVYSGAELLNEKEMLGLLPPGEELVTDIFARGRAIDHQTAYRPLFTSGKRRFLLRFDTDAGCPLLLGVPTKVDRITLDSLQLDIVYPSMTSPHDARRFSETILEIVTTLRDRFGPTGKRRAMVFSSDYPFPRLSASSIGTNRDMTPWSHQRVDLISAVTRWWFKDYQEKSAITRGLVSYLAWSTVFEEEGEAAARIWKAQHSPDSWKKNRRVQAISRLPLGADTSGLITESWFDAAVRWHTLRGLMGESAFARLVDSVFEHNPATVEALSAWTGVSTDPRFQSLFAMWTGERFEQGVRLNEAAFGREQHSGGWVVTASVSSEGGMALPVELAMVFAAGDTLLDTLSIDPAQSIVTYQSPPIREGPVWLILDPFYKLPDFDRRDNLGRLRVAPRPWLFLPRPAESLGAVVFGTP